MIPHRLKLSVLAGTFAVCRLDPQAGMPGWATKGPWFSVTRTDEEMSIVCAEGNVPAGVTRAGGWRALKLEGPFDLSQTGILDSVVRPLAEAGVNVFVLATYDTDYVLVGADRIESTAVILRAHGHTITA